MSDTNEGIGFFERYLTVWVILSIVVGIGIGAIAGDSIKVISSLEFNTINIPVALLVWAMIYPMMVQIDFSKAGEASHYVKGLSVTVIMNWLVKPFSMALFAWLFFSNIYSAWVSPELAKEYIAGAILLGAAPCTAMVFVWSYLTKGDANYTLSQVSINDLIILIAFIPLVTFLLGISDIAIPFDTLLTSVVVFVVIPLVAGFLTNRVLIKAYGEEWFTNVFLPKLKPVSIIALLSTLVLLFAFQGDKILDNPFHILLIAIPLTIQTYLIFFLTWKFGCVLKLPHTIVSPSAMIGASNFFELAVAVAIALFGLDSGASLVTVVGVLIEVPIMLSLVRWSNNHRFDTKK
ncbi:MAG: ACR3 family arsenite efflux transporter [Fibrobacterales bacterium]